MNDDKQIAPTEDFATALKKISDYEDAQADRNIEQKQQEYEKAFMDGFESASDLFIKNKADGEIVYKIDTPKGKGHFAEAQAGEYYNKDTIIEWLKDQDIIKTSGQEKEARKQLSELPSAAIPSADKTCEGCIFDNKFIRGCSACQQCSRFYADMYTRRVSDMDREEFMNIVYSELNDDGDNNRANRIIDAADEYAESKQEPCDDAISRQAVLEQTYNWSKDEFLRVTNPFNHLRKRINSLPPVNSQEPKTGHWIWKHDDVYVCSECEEETHVKEVMNKPQFVCCPLCGCPMEIEREKNMNGIIDENIHPCKGCEDYIPPKDCKSNGGCGRHNIFYEHMPEDFTNAVETIMGYCQNEYCDDDCSQCPHSLPEIRCGD